MNKRQFTVRNRKRRLLELAIVLASPVVAFQTMGTVQAELPTETTQRFVMPQSIPHGKTASASGKNAAQAKQQSNPFCQPVLTADSEPLDLSLALPLQSPIQLTSNEDKASHNEPQSEGRVQPVQVAPKRNQWVPTVDTTIQSKPIQPGRAANTIKDSLDQAHESPLVDGEVSFNPAELPVAKHPGVAAKAQAKPSSLDDLPMLPPPVHVHGKAKDDRAVSFSLNDDTLVETSVDAAKPHGTAAKAGTPGKSSLGPMLPHGASESVPPVVVSKSKNVIAQPASTQLVKPNSPAQPGKSVAIQSNRFANDSEVVINRGSGKDRTHLVPLSEPEMAPPVTVSATPDRRIVRGGRPAVDVGVLPVMIERTNASSGPLVESVAELNPANAGKYSFDKAFESEQVVVLDLKCTEVRALKLDQAISKVQVGDSKVCTAVAAGPSQVQLIGASDGVTRLAIWTSNGSGLETRNVYEIHVGQAKSSDASSPQSVAGQLTKTVQSAFPDCKLVVRADGEQLIVEGVCPNDQSAKKALRMIRSACLMPVVDKVAIR